MSSHEILIIPQLKKKKILPQLLPAPKKWKKDFKKHFTHKKIHKWLIIG